MLTSVKLHKPQETYTRYLRCFRVFGSYDSFQSFFELCRKSYEAFGNVSFAFHQLTSFMTRSMSQVRQPWAMLCDGYLTSDCSVPAMAHTRSMLQVYLKVLYLRKHKYQNKDTEVLLVVGKEMQII